MGENTAEKTRTMTAANIDLTELRSRCDEACKVLLADKEILARILKSTVAEFKDTQIDDIKNIYIEGKPIISEISVNPDETNARIAGGNNENSIYGEGTFTFDIKFDVVYPDKEIKTIGVKMIVDIEAQNKYHPGYAVHTRGIYYGCRMISSQYNREFTGNHYERIKKVYSIWICMEPAGEDKNTITTYRIMKENNVGESKDKPKTYDLLSVPVICLGGEEYENYDGIIKMLDVLLSKTKRAEEKKQILSKEFGIPMGKELRREIEDMCNISDYYYESGIREGLNRGISQGEIQATIQMGNDYGISQDEIINRLIYKYGLTRDIAVSKIEEYENIDQPE